jgi:hypothetical protein
MEILKSLGILGLSSQLALIWMKLMEWAPIYYWSWFDVLAPLAWLSGAVIVIVFAFNIISIFLELLELGDKFKEIIKKILVKNLK